jgi:hypothetical protein
MIYRVTGANKDTNAPMVLDIDATNKAAAELKASARGMAVTDVQELACNTADRPTSVHRGEGPAEGSTPDSGGMRNLIVVTVVLVALVIIGYFMLPMVLQRNVVSPPPATQAAG